MANPPGKRSPHKHGASTDAKRSGDPGPLVDPEAVAAVRRATARAVRVVHVGARSLGQAVVRAARWLGPRLVRLGAALARGLGAAVAALARGLWDRRGGLARIGHRGLWWGALAILVLVGRALLSADGDPELVEAAVLWFGAGLSMSVLVLLGAPEKRMRLAAFALAGGHGSLAALAWVALAS